MLESSSITLYGPSGAGKTSLIIALNWKLASMLADKPEAMKKHEMVVKFSAGAFDIYSQPEEAPEATELHQIGRVIIGREPRDTSDYRQQVSQFEHEINVNDDQGAIFSLAAQREITSLKQLLSQQNLDPLVSIAWNILKETHGIVVLLDPVLLKNSPYGGMVPGIEEIESSAYEFDLNSPPPDSPVQTGTAFVRRLFSQDEYARMVRNLTWLSPKIERTTRWGNKIEVPRRIAVCMTKSDRLGDLLLHAVDGQNVDKTIELVFGEFMKRALKELRDHFGENNVETYIVSALGFNPANGKPNWNPQTDWLENKMNWEPYQVHKPFFWILENMEQDDLKDHKGLPRFFRNALVHSRLKAYLPYSFLSNE